MNTQLLASRSALRFASSLLVVAVVACDEGGLTRPSGLPSYTRYLCADTAISLGVGESAAPAAGAAGCDLKPEVGAEYALAYLDTRAIASAQIARETTFADYTVSLTVAGAGPAAARRPAAAVRPAGVAVPPSVFDAFGAPSADQASELWPTEWTRPWWLSERLQLYDPYADSMATFRVVRVYLGCCVVAWTEGGDSTRLTRFLPQLDSAFDLVWTYGVPLMRRTFGDALPVTSTGAGQYLIVLRDTMVYDGRVLAGQVWGDLSPPPTLTWICLWDAPRSSYVGVAATLAHEMAHSYQRIALDATVASYCFDGACWPDPLAVWGASTWGEEGGASLIAYETIRRAAGVALDANYDWRNPGPSPAERAYASLAQPGYGRLTEGYEDAMGLLRDLVLRRMRAGDPINTAVREVSLGAIEGWYGYGASSRRTGLTARMQQRLGPGWNPADAVLLWALSEAADDLTPSPIFQDRASLRIWDIPSGQSYGWRADTTLSSGAGGSVMITRRYGSPGFSYVLDDGAGLSLQVSSPDAPIAWQLVRIR